MSLPPTAVDRMIDHATREAVAATANTMTIDDHGNVHVLPFVASFPAVITPMAIRPLGPPTADSLLIRKWGLAAISTSMFNVRFQSADMSKPKLIMELHHLKNELIPNLIALYDALDAKVHPVEVRPATALLDPSSSSSSTEPIGETFVRVFDSFVGGVEGCTDCGAGDLQKICSLHLTRYLQFKVQVQGMLEVEVFDSLRARMRQFEVDWFPFPPMVELAQAVDGGPAHRRKRKPAQPPAPHRTKKTRRMSIVEEKPGTEQCGVCQGTKIGFCHDCSERPMVDCPTCHFKVCECASA
jgi:hypothetical protein